MNNLSDSAGSVEGLQRMRAAGASIVLIAGLAASEGFTFWVGHRNRSVVLILLFVVWVGSPYLGLWRLAARQPQSYRTQRATDWLSLVLVALSVAIYGRVTSGPILAKPAVPFLIVPLAMWIFIAILAGIARRSPLKASDRQD
jgi:hypothetical protein